MQAQNDSHAKRGNERGGNFFIEENSDSYCSEEDGDDEDSEYFNGKGEEEDGEDDDEEYYNSSPLGNGGSHAKASRE